ncbi:UDP-glycosyltransferase 91A1-like [Camellia sinensis]|uniref:UDP-glycosyltransferase 91A1-like n=1 Tax=Camellia sinensis TaxID=4442 RepID=UPI0010363112|nr:UDP-glycosyltransferase 91A1-like [Camellia sinensis]
MELIAQNGLRVSFVSTPRNIQTPQIASKSIPFHQFSDIQSGPTPPKRKIHTRSSPPQSQVPREGLFLRSTPTAHASDSLRFISPLGNLRFRTILARPSCLQTRHPQSLLQCLRCAFWVLYQCQSARVVETIAQHQRTSLTAKPKWIPFESKIGFKLFEINFNDISTNDENVPTTFHFGAEIEACDILAVRSSNEFEPELWKRFT